MRWAEVAPRAWRLGSIVDVTLDADETWLRAALDAILENAVHHTEPYAAIELSAHGDLNDVVIVVTDGGSGIPTEPRSTRSSSASPAPTTLARAGKAVPGSAWRSSRRSPAPTAARARPTTSTGAGASFELRLPLRQAAQADEERGCRAAS